MSSSYLTLMINKSLHEIEKTSAYDDKNLIKNKDDTHIETLAHDDFRALHANICIKTLSGNDEKDDIEGPLISNMNDKYKSKITKALEDQSNKTELVPFIDYRLVIKGLKKSNAVPIEFVDRNEHSKPRWCRMDKLISNVPKKESIDEKNHSGVIEIEDDMKKLNITSMSCLSIDDDFWNDIERSVKKDDIGVIYPPPIDIPSMVSNKPWTEINTLSVTIHDYQIEEELKDQCEWMQLFNVFKTKKELTRKVTKEEAKEALKKLIACYKKSLLFKKSIFSIRTVPSHYKNSVRAIVQLHRERKHLSSKNGNKCFACEEATDTGLMKQVIMACAIVVTRFDSIKYKPPPHSDKYLKSNFSYINANHYS